MLARSYCESVKELYPLLNIVLNSFFKVIINVHNGKM